MNKCVFVGRLTKDPETRPAGETSVTNFSLAVENRYEFQGNQKVETDFLDFQAWAGLGEVIAKHCNQGDQMIVGCIAKKDTWKDKEDGTGRSRTYFKVLDFTFGAKKKGSAAPAETAEEAVAASA